MRKRPFFFLAVAASLSLAVSNGSTSKAEKAKIEKAREFILKNDRTGALKILKEAHRDDTHARELAGAWQEIAEVFLSDRGQNQYSLAESIWMTKPKDALDVLQPLVKLEDGNVLVSRLGARAALRTGECVKAETFTQQAELAYPIGADIKLLRLQVQDCVNGASASAPALKIPSDTEWGEYDSAVRMLTVKDDLRRKDVKAARAALTAWETAPSNAGIAVLEDPEFWFWKWKSSPETGRDRSAGRKYLQLCTEMTARRRKNFAMYPELCLHTETVESNLKSSDKSGP